MYVYLISTQQNHGYIKPVYWPVLLCRNWTCLHWHFNHFLPVGLLGMLGRWTVHITSFHIHVFPFCVRLLVFLCTPWTKLCTALKIIKYLVTIKLLITSQCCRRRWRTEPTVNTSQQVSLNCRWHWSQDRGVGFLCELFNPHDCMAEDRINYFK